MNTTLIAFMGMGMHEMLIVLAIFLLLFGSSKLPSLMRSVGASAREFKKGVQGIDEDIDEPKRTIEEEKTE
jgi:sec-independent protein translocase protein TatA